MKILITNNSLSVRSGSELYAEEVALELARRGHKVAAYSNHFGLLGERMKERGIEAVDDLRLLAWKPDIIHGQHHLETMTALIHFNSSPAVYFCHGWRPWQEKPPLHPRIFSYASVDTLTRKHAIEEHGVSEEKICLVHNFVDLMRFKLKKKFSLQAKRVLVFNNGAKKESGNYFFLIEEACQRSGLKADLIGIASGKSLANPEDILLDYDIVFAVGRSAIEALATGAAVIICNDLGVGPMVELERFGELRDKNFGVAAIHSKLSVDAIHQEILKYNPKNAQAVAEKLRETAGIEQAVDEIEKIYAGVLENFGTHKRSDKNEDLAVSVYLREISIFVKQKDDKLHKCFANLRFMNENLEEVEKKIKNLFEEKERISISIKNMEDALKESDAKNKNLTKKIDWMRSSKFWKAREFYLKVKNKIFTR